MFDQHSVNLALNKTQQKQSCKSVRQHVSDVSEASCRRVEHHGDHEQGFSSTDERNMAPCV